MMYIRYIALKDFEIALNLLISLILCWFFMNLLSGSDRNRKLRPTFLIIRFPHLNLYCEYTLNFKHT